MKVFSTKQVRAHDDYTIKHEPNTSVELMERAATRITDWLVHRLSDKPIKVFCGVGNNGGDGLVCASLLKQRGHPVEIFVVHFSDNHSADFETNLGRLKEAGIGHHDIITKNDIPVVSVNDLIIDAIFGSGLNRAPDGLSAEVIGYINHSGAEVIAIDVPSGLFADDHSPAQVVRAHHTISLQHPKLAFFMPENAEYVGEWHVIDIGLHPKYYEETQSPTFYTTEDDLRNVLKTRSRFTHKGDLGHALMATGSKGMMGAAVLTTKAALRSGAGLVTTYIPQCGYEIMQESVPEAMAMASPDKDILSSSPFGGGLEAFDSIGVGPGIGTAKPTQEMLSRLLDHWKKPLVIDADALNIIALEHWLDRIPKNSILTPHPGEFKRLAGESSNDFEMLQKQRQLSTKHGIYIVLKRANTCVTFPDGTAHFNSSGSPALATGGSGDVLTGIITGLLAQGYEPGDAARLGVWLQGKSGEIAAEKSSDEAVIAGDIIENLGGAFTWLHQPTESFRTK